MTVAAPAAPTRALPALGQSGWLGLAAACAVAAVFLLDPRVFNDGDTYWHLGAGEWMLRHARVPDVDVFSHSRPGAPWTAHEYLAEVLMTLAYRAGGWSGLAVLFAASAAATAMLLVRRLSFSLSGLGLIVAVVGALSLGAGSLLARPHVLVLPVLMVWTVAMLRARDADRAPPLAWAALMLLWANLHGSYVFGFVVAAALALEALITAPPERRWPVVRDWGAFGLLSLGAAMLTPHGPAGLLYPFYVMTLEATAGIGEWAPVDLTAFGPLQVMLFLTLFVGLERGLRVPPVRLLLLLLLLFMALQHQRHGLVLGLVAPLLLADPLARALQQPSPAPFDRRAVGLLIALLTAAAVLRLAVPIQRTEDRATPAAALGSVPAALAAQPVLNEYSYGGYLIFRGVRPFIDGRADMYGDPFFEHYLAAVEGGDDPMLDRLLDEHRIAWTIFPSVHPVTARMDGRPGWRRLPGGGAAAVHVRAQP